MTTDGRSSFARLALRLGAIGDRPDDSADAQLRHRLLVFMGVLMSGGGLLWGSIALYFGLPGPAIVPYGYVVITAVNLAYFRRSKSFGVARGVQVSISLLLPFLFQWSLGGFEVSGAVMLWAMLALVGSLTFSDAREAAKWLVVFVLLSAISGLIDPWVRARFSSEPAPLVRTLFFVINVVVISSIVFGLTIYIVFERERTQRNLAEAEAASAAASRVRAILDNMADGLVAVGVDLRIQAINPSLVDMLFLEGELLGERARDVLPRELANLAEAAMGGESRVARMELPLGSDRTGAAVATCIHDEDDECTGAVVILRDVTLEKEIDRMKTDFIATVSHELRTPLTSVLGFAKVSKNKLEQSVFEHVPADAKKGQRAVRQVAQNLDIMVAESQRLTALINDVLDISKMESGQVIWKREPIEPAALVERAVAASAGLFEDTGVELRRAVDEDVPAIEGDPDRLLQVLLNLISNAAKFTDEGHVIVGARSRGPYTVELWVEDTGLGIAASDQSAIFEKFKQGGDTLTNKPDGTGLGLPICVSILHAHQGKLRVESEPGNGARFIAMIPVDRSTPR